MSQKIDHQVVRSMVVAALTKPRGYGVLLNIKVLHNAIIEYARQNNITHDNNGRPVELWHATTSGGNILREDYALCVQDILWDMIVEGIVRPGSTHEGQIKEWPYIHITEYGKEVLKNPLSPHDSEGYLAALKREVPNVDDAILKYVNESLRAHRNNCSLSSTVMIGCASEKTFLLLSETLASCLDSSLIPQWEQELKKNRTLKLHHQVFMEWYRNKIQTPLKRSKGSDWETETEDALDLILSYFRKVRNDAGHPTGSQFTKETTLGHLHIFPHYLKRIYDLIDWLRTAAPIS